MINHILYKNAYDPLNYERKQRIYDFAYITNLTAHMNSLKCKKESESILPYRKMRLDRKNTLMNIDIIFSCNGDGN